MKKYTIIGLLISTFINITFGQKEETKDLNVSWNNVSEQFVIQSNTLINLIDTLSMISNDSVSLSEEKRIAQDFRNYLKNIVKIEKESFEIVNKKYYSIELGIREALLFIEKNKLEQKIPIRNMVSNINGNFNRIILQKHYFNQACAYNKPGFFFKSNQEEIGVEK